MSHRPAHQDELNIPFHVVLVHPQIPPNTGNVGRLCVGTGCHLHLIEPLGFSTDEAAVRRAGLDYWPHLGMSSHKSWLDLIAQPTWDEERAWFFSTRATKVFPKEKVQAGDWLIFGREADGLPEDIRTRYDRRLVHLPMFGPVRSMNLSNAVAVAVYQGLETLAPDAFSVSPHASEECDQ